MDTGKCSESFELKELVYVRACVCEIVVCFLNTITTCVTSGRFSICCSPTLFLSFCNLPDEHNE
jgi:hypothetical protein